jgi:RNA-directed DNA polymerase
VPQRVREKSIPKTSGKVRRLGTPTTRDRILQAAMKLVLEPIFEADFQPCSYGFRPRRRAQDAIAEIHFFTSPARNCEWVFEADIKACFDEIDHTALMGHAAGAHYRTIGGGASRMGPAPSLRGVWGVT